MTALRLLKRIDGRSKGHTDVVTLLQWNRKGILSGGRDATIRYFSPYLEQKAIFGIPRGVSPSFIAFASPDEIVASTWDEKELHVYDLIAGTEKKWASFEAPLRIKQFSWIKEPPNFAGFRNNEIYLFDPLKISTTSKTIPAKDVKSLDMSPTYPYLFWADDNRLHIYDLKKEKEVQRKIVSGLLSVISVHPASPIIAVGHLDDNSVDLWDYKKIDSLKKIKNIDLIDETATDTTFDSQSGIRDVQWSSQGALAIFPLHPWFYIYQNNRLKQFKYDRPIQAFVWKGDGSKFIVGSKRDILQGNPIPNTSLETLVPGNQEFNYALQWELEKNLLAYVKNGTMISIFNPEKMKSHYHLNVEKLLKKPGQIYDLAWKHPLLAFSAESKLFFIKTDSWKAGSKLDLLCRLLEFSPVSSKKLAAIIWEEGKYYLKIYDLEKKIIPISILIEQNTASNLTWSADERFIAITTDQSEILLVDLATKTVKSLIGHENTVFDVAWNEESLLASASGDGTIRIWKPGKTNPKVVLNSPSAEVVGLKWLSATKLIAVCSNGMLELWDVENPEKGLFSCTSGHGQVLSLAVQTKKEGIKVATTGIDGSLALWELDNPA